MATIIRPPPAPLLKTNQRKKPYFTLHKHNNSIMAWETTTMKMSVVAFSRPLDVHKMGSIIECHYENTREWPDFRTMTFHGGPSKNKPLEILDIYEWSDLDELKVFCVQHFFDLIVVDKVSETFNIKGAAYGLNIPMEAHVPYLKKLLNENDA